MTNIKDTIYNCRQATFLIEKQMLNKLTFKEGIELRVHLVGCDMCKLYLKQSYKINDMIKQILKPEPGLSIQLDDSFKIAMQVQINEQLNKF